jgi:hypothetical protein
MAKRLHDPSTSRRVLIAVTGAPGGKRPSPIGNHGDQLVVLPSGQKVLHTRPSWPMTKSVHDPSSLLGLMAARRAPIGKVFSPMGNHGDQLAVLPPGQNELHTRPSWPMRKSEHAPSRLRVLIAVTGAPGGNVLSPSANHPDQSDVPSRGQ